VDVREVQGCTCLRLRRAARRVTRLYDRALEPAGLTITQFGLLAHLHHRDGMGMGALAEWVGMDPTTLNRALKPLLTGSLVRVGAHPQDGRVRAVGITAAGRAKLRDAVPLWRRAQDAVEGAVGGPAVLALNGLLDLAAARVDPETPSEK
jgi:DNA-binding MarR family transcriptional regulator